MKLKIDRYSESMEDYLEMINMLGGDNVRSVDIATHMHVSKASVNRAVNVLIEKGLVHKAPYGEIGLTDLGRATSEAVLHKHTVIRRFLIDILGVPQAVADTEACGIEHNVGEDTLKRLETWVNSLMKSKENEAD
ncbi:MAG TPA: metal-dependent transcriptional regulator [Candidatus Izemoplasmatales bacterium]|nr:metal-dependent transcriptional regulator [Candidatus Izemoplasmatales bacterium]